MLGKIDWDEGTDLGLVRTHRASDCLPCLLSGAPAAPHHVFVAGIIEFVACRRIRVPGKPRNGQAGQLPRR